MEILAIRHDWPEKAGFMISRPHGRADYTFLHFMRSMEISVGGKIVSARPGACIFYAPGTPQWFRSETGIIHNWVHLSASWQDVLARYAIPVDELLYPHATSFISELFRRAEAEFFSDDPFRAEMLEAYMTEFLIRFSRSVREEPHLPSVGRPEREKMQALRQTILSSPENKWTVPEMAALVSLSPSRFHTVYKAVFGTSPMRDVIEARIRYAQSLLLSDGSIPLADIAEILGYSDQYHFIRQFKTVTGETPGAYRKSRR
ncbi:MAG: helix-turn-helix domain-containing protein [Hominenteromicrobium sp.]